MNEDTFKSLLQQLCVRSEVTEFEKYWEEKFRAVVYCELAGDTYDDQCAKFIENFSKETHTNWITYKRFGQKVRYLFRKTYACQLSKKNKTNKGRNYLNKIRDKECTAKVDFKWKKVKRDTWRNDPNLKTGLNCIILIEFDHSHPLYATDSMAYLRCNKSTVEVFNSYFQMGLSPAEAKSYNEILLIEYSEDENSILIDLANAQINPTLRQVMHLYDIWKKDNEQEIVKSFDNLLSKKENLEKKGFTLSVDEKTSSVAIVSPVMKRVFTELAYPQGDRLTVIIDNTDQYAASKLAGTNPFLSFFFVTSKIGALPFGCVLHTSDNTELAFKTLKEALEHSTKKTFVPGVLIVGDSAVQRIACQLVFPTAKNLLSTSQIRQGVWRWLCMSKNNIKENDRKPIMEQFQEVALSESVDSTNELFKTLCTKIKCYPQAVKYFEHLWFRRSEWCLCFRSKLPLQVTNMDDCETSIRILKDALLQRCKNFNPSVLVDVICSSFENYHRLRLEDFAASRDDKVTTHYSKYIKSAAEMQIVEVGVSEYQVQSRTGQQICKVYTNIAMCDCNQGRVGKYCEHLCAVGQKLNFWVRDSPTLSAEDKQIFAKLVSDNKDKGSTTSRKSSSDASEGPDEKKRKTE